MMHSPLFPTTPIPDTLIHQLRESSAGAEAAGQLTERQRSLIQRERWFRMFVPRALGGLELLLPEGLQLQEGLARTDGSLGWTVTLCSGATMFAGYMEP